MSTAAERLERIQIKILTSNAIKKRFKNNTGAPSVRGELVETDHTLPFAVETLSADGEDCIGVWAENGIGDGGWGDVIISGPAYVLLEDNTTATAGYWTRSSVLQAGRADATLPDPPGGGVVQADQHFREIGHCLETVSAGTDKLALINLHFN